MTSTPPSQAKVKPRHPSAGNLNNRPSLVAQAENTSSRPAPQKGDKPKNPAPDPADKPPSLSIATGMDPEATRKLFGHLKERRVLELGVGSGHNAVAMAQAGARVIAIDPSGDRLTRARHLAENHNVKIEFHHGDFADLAFISAERIDFAIAIYSLAEVTDVARVFRQVHRVIRPESSLLLSLPHPLRHMLSPKATKAPPVVRSFFDDSPLESAIRSESIRVQPHRISDVVVALSRSNFRVDLLLEPANTNAAELEDINYPDLVPTSFVVRGRKERS